MNEDPVTEGKPAKQKPTEYVVLQVLEGGAGQDEPRFRVCGGIKDGVPATTGAPTRKDAVNAMSGGAPGTYIPVPLASFKPIRFQVEQKPVPKFETVSL